MSLPKTLAEVMPASRLLCLAPETTVAVAAKRMVERRTGAVAVMQGGQLVGIVTDRDIAFRMVAAGRSAVTTSLLEIMTPEPDCLPITAKMTEALELMQAGGYRHIPVESQGRIVGMISAQNLFADVRRELMADIQVRDEFMFGSGYSVPVSLHS